MVTKHRFLYVPALLKKVNVYIQGREENFDFFPDPDTLEVYDIIDMPVGYKDLEEVIDGITIRQYLIDKVSQDGDIIDE